MNSHLPIYNPVADLFLGGGGSGTLIHTCVGLVTDTMSESDRRFIVSKSLDCDEGPPGAATQNQHLIGQISNTESGGHDDMSIVQAVVLRDDGRRTADAAISRTFGARGDRRTGHRAFADDLATRELSVAAIARGLTDLDAMRPLRINVHLFGGVGGAVGSNFVVVGRELVDEAARRAGIKANIRLIIHCLSPSLSMLNARPGYQDENAVATLIDVNAIACGLPLTFLLHDVAPRVPDEIYFHEIKQRSASLHSNSGAEEAQRAIPASYIEIVRTSLDLSRADTGAILRSNFTNTMDAASENNFRIAQGQGVHAPAREYAELYTAKSVQSFLARVAQRKAAGEPQISSDLKIQFGQEVATGVEGAEPLMQGLNQSFLVAVTDPDARLMTDGTWQHAMALSGGDPDRTDVIPIKEAIPLKVPYYSTIDRRIVAQFAEDLSNYHEASIAEARETFGSMRNRVVAALGGYFSNLFLRVLNGHALYADERNRAALYSALLGIFEIHLNRLVSAWLSSFKALASVPDGSGGWGDKRKQLITQIENELTDLSESLVCQYVPFVGWLGLRRVRQLAAERLDVDLLDVAVRVLESMAGDIRAQLRSAVEWSTTCASILDGVEREGKRRVAEAESALAFSESYGAAILVGQDRLRTALAAVEQEESERLTREVVWSLSEGRAVGTVATIALEQRRRGTSTADERNYELTSRAADAACRRAAATIDLTSCIAEEFETPEQLLDTLRRSVNPEGEVELDGIKSSAQPAKSIVVAIPRAPADDAVAYFDQLKRALRDEEKVILIDAAEVRYISAIAGVPLPRLRFVCRAGRGYVNSDRMLHISPMLERSRLVSRELHRSRGVTWIPPLAIASLLEDPLGVRAIAIATSVGLLKGVEIKTSRGLLSVWTTACRKPSSANPLVTVTGMKLLNELRREPMRSDLAREVDRFDGQRAARRLDILTRAQAAMIEEPPVCLGDDKDLLRLVDVALLAEVTRLQRTASPGEADQ